MARNTHAALSTQALSAADEEDRWPAPYPAMLVAVTSILLWAAIIGGLRWVVG